MIKFSLALLFVFILSATSSRNDSIDSSSRQRKMFSLFSIVQFKNLACNGLSDSTTTGSCMTASECLNRGGSPDGNCASGFGQCCVFIVNNCGGSVNQNCTYIRNAEFPATAPASQTCRYSFNRICPELCQIRLDFSSLTTAQPPTATVNAVGDCATGGDVVTVDSPTGKDPPLVCGTLTGQHMFLETGNSGSAGSIEFTFGTTTATRTYNVKVTYYQCDSRNRAPADCVQYYTGLSGTTRTYNWPNQMIDNQDFMTCFRQEQGYCAISFSQSPVSGTDDSFDFWTTVIAGNGATDTETTACSNNYVGINADLPDTGTAGSRAASRFCGQIFSNFDNNIAPGVVTSSSTPFQINTFSANNFGTATAINPYTGYSLEFVQRPCNS